jgi:hypothetical protein
MIAPAKETPSQAKRQPFEIIECEIARFATSLIFKDLIAILFRRCFPLLPERRKKGAAS